MRSLLLSASLRLQKATGGALIINQSSANLGTNIFKVGIILQACSYFVFIFLIGYTHWHVRREGVATGRERWWIIIRTLYVSSAAIIVRSGYRLASQVEGRTSVLNTNEGSSTSPDPLSTENPLTVYFYVLDVLALYVAIGIYVPWWPAKYMFDDTILDPAAYKLVERPRPLLNGV